MCRPSVAAASAAFMKCQTPNLRRRKACENDPLYIRDLAFGIYIADQWKAEKKTRISVRLIRAQGKDKSGNYIDTSNNADAFFVIE